MADDQKENFTAIPNEILEALARVRLSPYQRCVLDVILRKTYGWHKESDAIARSQFSKLTGIAERNIPRTIDALEAKNIIKVARQKKNTLIVSIQKDLEKWLLVSPQIQERTKQLVSHQSPACISTDTKTCIPADTHKRKKENNKRKQEFYDRETLKQFLCGKYTSLNDLIFEFIDRVRKADKLKSITKTGAIRIVESLKAITDKYGVNCMNTGIQAVFKKTEREGFDFNKGFDPTAYVRTVAEAEYNKKQQQQIKTRHEEQKKAIDPEMAKKMIANIQQRLTQQNG